MAANSKLWLPGRWLALCAALALTCSGASIHAQVPSNDEKEGAIEVSLPFSVSQDTSLATKGWSDPWGCVDAYENGASVWYRLNVTEDATARINSCDSNYDTIIGVWTVDEYGNPLECVACNDDYCWPGSLVEFPVKAGSTYYIVVKSYYGTGAWLGMSGEALPPPPPPPTNDEYTGAVEITALPFAFGQVTTLATRNDSDPFSSCFWYQDEATVWFRLTPSTANPVRVATDGTDYGYAPVLSVWQADDQGVPGIEVGCSESFPIEGFGERSQVDFTPGAGQTYFIRVGNSPYRQFGGWLHLLVDEIGATPENDTIEGAKEVTLPAFTDVVNTNGATRTPDEPPFNWFNDPGRPWWVGYTVWYKVTPSERTKVAVNTLGSNYNTTITLFRQVGQNLEFIVGDDDTYPMDAAMEFTAEAGQTYYLMVGARGTTGRLVFNATARPNPVTLTPPAQISGEIAEFKGQPIPLTATVVNAAGHETRLTWMIGCERIEQILPAGPAPTTNTITLSRQFCVGYHPITLIACDGDVTETAATSVSIVDNEPPLLTLSLAKKQLYPADLTLRLAGTATIEEYNTWQRTDGIPADGRLASTADLGIYQLGPMEWLNSIHITESLPEVAIPVPQARYERFGLVAASTPWNADLDVVIRYADGSEDVIVRGLHAPDWSEPNALAPIIISAMDRSEYWGNPRDDNSAYLFESIITPRQDRDVVGLTVRRVPEHVAFYWDNRTNVMALNGKVAGVPIALDLSGCFNRDVITARTEFVWIPPVFFDDDGWGTNLIEGYTEALPATATSFAIYSDEDDVIAGARKNDSPDMKLLPDGGLRLRAERKDGGDGRVYLIVLQATDGYGYSSMLCDTVVVPLRNSGSALTVVNWQASQALAYAQKNNGAAPPGFFTVGDGPVIGPRQ